MKIELHEITVRELTKGYEDNNEDVVRADGGNLDVRPPYQREFVYKENGHKPSTRTRRNMIY